MSPFPPRRRPRSERGAAAVTVLPFVGLLALACALLAFQGGVLVAQRRAQSAADLAALAAAGAARRGEDACAAAASLAAFNTTRLVACRREGGAGLVVQVTVARDGPDLLGRAVTVQAAARAGPSPR